jgi:penicillin G amidase
VKPLRIKNARRRFSADRDDNGVPHIRANDWPSALYGLGYLHALDRPTQILFSQAVAWGRSAELIADKPELVETDRFFRRVGLYLHLEREVAGLDDVTFGNLTAYCEGVNDGMKSAGRSLPMWAVGFHPQPWNQQSVLLVGNLLNYGGLVVSQQQNERLLLELIQSGVDRDKLRELFSPLLDNADFDLLARIKIASRLSDEALELITDLPRLAGSNAWAVAPERSASGHALLASDPHLEVNRLPAIWYEAVLEWDEHYLLGATLPGCPFFAVARTSRLAWGVTYLKGDTCDYFIEDCRPSGEGWQYRRGDQWHDFNVRIEEIGRKGETTETMRVYFNHVGTLECEPATSAGGLCLSTAWSGDAEGSGSSISTWLHLIDCQTTAEAMDLVRECPQPTLSWIFADREGHIGWQTNGRFPRRAPPYTGILPIPAWDPANHWQGWIPTDELPRLYNPPEGYVASANEDINRPGGPRLVTQVLPDYRRRRIDERLQALPRATLSDMQELQYDVLSTQARDLLQVFLPCLEKGLEKGVRNLLPDRPEGRLAQKVPDTFFEEVRQRLAAWDCRYAPDSLEATLFQRLYRNVLLEIFGQEIGWRRMLFLCTRAGFSMMVITCIDRMLKKEQSLWWQGRDKCQLIRMAAGKLASEVDQPWSKTNAFKFTNRYFETQFVGRALGMHTQELPMLGNHATPFQGHLLRAARRETTFAPSYHFVTDLGSDEAWTNLPGGPQESWFSKWYRNEIPRWLSGEYKRLAREE